MLYGFMFYTLLLLFTYSMFLPEKLEQYLITFNLSQHDEREEINKLI